MCGPWQRDDSEAKGFLHKAQQETWYKATRDHDWRQTKVTSVYSRKHTHTHMHTQVQQWQSDAFWASLSAISSQQQIFCSLGQMTLRTTDSYCTALGCLISTLDRRLQTYRTQQKKRDHRVTVVCKKWTPVKNKLQLSTKEARQAVYRIE